MAVEMQAPQTMPALSEDHAREVQRRFGTPAFVYDQSALERAAEELLAFPAPFGLTARFAMKALPTAAVLRIFDRAGLHVDASSGYEVERALRAGIAPRKIQLTAQQLPQNLQDFVEMGVLFNACSLYQLENYGNQFPGRDVSIRVNPGLGSGHSNRTNVGGPSSSFGIWHEHLDEVEDIRKRSRLRITGLHTHIGSGADPAVWKHCADLTLEIAGKLPAVQRVNLGGGFKAGRMPLEAAADMLEIGVAIGDKIEEFAETHGRRLHLELEPGTWLVANAGSVVATVVDVVDTGESGYRFIKVDTGMPELLRISLYGAQQPITLVPAENGPERAVHEYIVVGHCCESGDLLTPEPGNPEALAPRTLPEPRPGDILVIGGAGAYCSGMGAKNYNSFPEAPEVLVTRNGNLRLVRRRQTLEQIIKNEIELD